MSFAHGREGGRRNKLSPNSATDQGRPEAYIRCETNLDLAPGAPATFLAPAGSNQASTKFREPNVDTYIRGFSGGLRCGMECISALKAPVVG